MIICSKKSIIFGANDPKLVKLAFENLNTTVITRLLLIIALCRTFSGHQLRGLTFVYLCHTNIRTYVRQPKCVKFPAYIHGNRFFA